MPINAKDVSTYIQEAPTERQETLTRLREMCRVVEVQGNDYRQKMRSASYY